MSDRAPGPNQFHLAILEAALAEPFGLVLQTSDAGRARQLLYRARAEAHDPGLAILQIRTSPFPDGDLVICHPPAKPEQDH